MSIIKNSSYYIPINRNEPAVHKAIIYDVDGNQLNEIPLLLSEYYYSSSDRLDKMLDPACVGKARPAKVVIGYHIKLGRTIYLRDKNDNIIGYQRYDGPLDIAGLVDHQLHGKNYEYSLKVDYNWMLENNVPVTDSYSGRSWCSLV